MKSRETNGETQATEDQHATRIETLQPGSVSVISTKVSVPPFRWPSCGQLAEFVDVDVDAVSVYVIVRVVVVVRRWRVGEDSEYRAECGGDDAEDLGVGGLFADGEIHFGLAVLALDPISQKWGLFVDVGVLA